MARELQRHEIYEVVITESGNQIKVGIRNEILKQN